MTTLSIYDSTGTKRDAAWLQASYGDVRVSGDAGEVVLLENTGGAATLVVTRLDADHGPLVGREVVFGWPDGQVIGETNAEGAVGFGMGGGAYYPAGGKGPHYVESGGVRVDGLGFKWGTNHHHLDVVVVEGEPEPPPGPGPEPPPPEPEPEPEPPPGPEPEERITVLPGRVYSARLVGDQIHWSEGRDADAAWYHVGYHLPGVDLWLPYVEPALPLLVAWTTETRMQAERLERVVQRLQDS